MRYDAIKNDRTNKRFWGMTPLTDLNWWYNFDLKRWEESGASNEHHVSSHQPCKSVRAFRRKLKQAPIGVEFVLCSRWVGRDVYGHNTTKQKGEVF